jgi:hypothetical protein
MKSPKKSNQLFITTQNLELELEGTDSSRSYYLLARENPYKDKF